MAGEINTPGLGLFAFWNLGDDTWKDGMDLNLVLVSALASRAILSQESAVPATPAAGGIYLATTDWGATVTANSLQIYLNQTGFAPSALPAGVAVRNGGEWIEVVPQEGWAVYDQGADARLRYDGAAWNTEGQQTGMSLIDDPASDRSLLNADFAGNLIIGRSNAAAQTVTVPPGLAGTEPVTFVVTGAGALTFTPGTGVTINSAGGSLVVSTQYASVTLIPQGADSYLLIGGLD